uniref:Replication initiation and membrane attachment n=1 Tax=Siphoviridae sp. ctbgC51 TaxID=2827901 RepID=A0A8S5TF59_9CAUD|nr:MAG TPA: Replication initiation and membrane attachment [Siphoviridae sp. ctbgC51]
MATGKRFYWMKLKENFMTSDTIDYFMSQPDGANYVVLYQMLCLKTINTNGRLSRQIGEVVIKYDISKIQRDLKWFSADTIRVALNLYKAFGLVYEDVDGTLVLTDHRNLVGSETDAASRMRNVRSRKADVLPEGVTQGEQTANIVTPEIENRDRDKSIEKEIEEEIEEVPNGTSCAEPEKSDSTPPVISLILNDKSFFDVTDEDVAKWNELYPAVDVMQELRKMAGWCESNTTKRKTRRGVRAFITSWLARAQDRGGSQNNYCHPRPTLKDSTPLDYGSPEDFYK